MINVEMEKQPVFVVPEKKMIVFCGRMVEDKWPKLFACFVYVWCLCVTMGLTG